MFLHYLIILPGSSIRVVQYRFVTSLHCKPGAGDGNRTHAASLGSSYSTIELHPHYYNDRCQSTKLGARVTGQGQSFVPDLCYLTLNFVITLIPRQPPIIVITLLYITITEAAQSFYAKIFDDIRSHNGAVDYAFSNFGIRREAPALSEIAHKAAGKSITSSSRVVNSL